MDQINSAKGASAQLVQALREHGEILPALEDEDEFGAFFDRFGDARVVLLGESTHGTSEFYRARAAITRRLIEHHGFSTVAVEADWPDAARIDHYVRHHAPRPKHGESFVRFPTWMWRNREMLEFADWMRAHNALRDGSRQVSFHGLDIYSMSESIEAVLTYLDRVDPEEAARARERYACLMPWQAQPVAYGRAVLSGEHHGCEEPILAELKALLDKRIDYLREGNEAWFDAVQNARIVRGAEHYYRAIYEGDSVSWNLRDRHMFQTLQALLAFRGQHGKAVVWAHNLHIGDASATAMGWRGDYNIGQLCRVAYGDDCVLIGFGTDSGSVAAASDWGGEMEVKSIRHARGDSYEHAFRATGQVRSLTDWRERAKQPLANVLREPLLERAIGVIYRPEVERHSHYFEAILADQFDAWVWFANTHAVTPLGREIPHGAPETYPFGV